MGQYVISFIFSYGTLINVSQIDVTIYLKTIHKNKGKIIRINKQCGEQIKLNDVIKQTRL